MPRSVTFYYPGRRFPALSVTGAGCALQCDHCRGRYLRGMEPLNGPDDLLAVAERLTSEGATGFLLSGGCDPRGRVALGPYLPVVRRIKATTPLAVNLHTGLLDEAAARELRECGADSLSVDVVQDPRTITEVLHLPAGPRDYARTLELLDGAAGLVPHLCVGLQSPEGERASIELVSRTKIAGLIVLGLMGARGSPWDGRNVETGRLVETVEGAVRSVNAPVVLGCMRPRGDPAAEVQCLEAGASGVVNPSPRTVEWAKEKGWTVAVREECCSVHL